MRGRFIDSFCLVHHIWVGERRGVQIVANICQKALPTVRMPGGGVDPTFRHAKASQNIVTNTKFMEIEFLS